MRVDPDTLRQSAQTILKAAGVDEAQIATVTDNLVWCDMVGRRNHGVERLPILLKRVAAGLIQCPCDARFEAKSTCVETLHAGNGFGHHAGRLAIDRACDLAASHGVGVVGVTDSNFYGAGAYYVHRAAERGMVSFALSNSFSKVAAPGGIRPILGTNPFAFGAPRRDGRTLMVDMSTASVAGSTIREKIVKNERLPEGIAIDEEGRPILDPSLVSKGTLLPAAGAKGFGLAILVEVLSAVLTGAGIGREVGSMYSNFEEGGHNGHFFLALDIQRWLPLEDYHARIDLLAMMLAESGPDGRVRMPGDARWSELSESLEKGVYIEEETVSKVDALAGELGVTLPWH